MGLNIKNPEAHLMAQELSKLTGESMTTAVTIALRERLDRVRQQQGLGPRRRNCLEQRTTMGANSSAPASKMGSATAKGEVALSSQRRDLIDQPIVRCFERIDKSNSRQFKAILEVLGKQMANAGPFIPCPYNIASRTPVSAAASPFCA